MAVNYDSFLTGRYQKVDLNQYVPGSNFITWGMMLKRDPPNSNILDLGIYNAIVQLTINLLDPIFARFQFEKLNINSGLRPIVASKYSQHGVGQAADLSISPINHETNNHLFYFIKDNLTFDQCLWETRATGTPPPDGIPGWVHVSWDNTLKKQRGAIYYIKKDINQNFSGWTQAAPTLKGDSSDLSDIEQKKAEEKKIKEKKKTEDENENQNPTEIGNELAGGYAKTFEQITNNISNIELSDTAVTWGKKSSLTEDCDWISLKQYLLYLATIYTPQSLYPFAELIPNISLENKDYERDGSTPEDVKGAATNKANDKNKLKEKLQKTVTSLAPKGRRETGAKAFNNANQLSDLYSLDPFQEGYESMGVLSKGGKQIVNSRHVGIRAYSQLVLTPSAFEGSASKPGPIGFTELEVQAGAQCENGLALIKMKLVDVQGNKFTDLTSPWSFIYDARPGGIGGDYWFRYGWQIRLPDPADKKDPISRMFWSHPGWQIFGDNIKNFIAGQVLPTKPYITLTQAINSNISFESFMTDKGVKTNKSDLGFYNMFDEGVTFNEIDGTVSVSRESLNYNNYVKLSILNPEIEVDEFGALHATLSFRTTGAIAQTIPLAYAKNLKRVIRNFNELSLGDLILLVMSDTSSFNYLLITDEEKRKKQYEASKNWFSTLATDPNRSFEGLVYVTGLEKGGNTGGVNPDEIKIKINKKRAKELTQSDPENPITIIRWFRQVLNDNGAELNSAATGSGAGINSAWVICVTDKFDKENYRKIKREKKEKMKYTQALDTMIHEKDVFSFRFQGTLVNNLNIEKTEADNALKIKMDYSVADFLPSLDSEPTAKDFNKPVTMEDRTRNLAILFSQLQNCKIDCLAHPWMGPGKRFFIKGMGFFDGEYMALRITHKLDNSMKFISTVEGARIIVPEEEEEKQLAKEESNANGKNNMTSQVSAQETTS